MSELGFKYMMLSGLIVGIFGLALYAAIRIYRWRVKVNDERKSNERSSYITGFNLGFAGGFNDGIIEKCLHDAELLGDKCRNEFYRGFEDGTNRRVSENRTRRKL